MLPLSTPAVTVRGRAANAARGRAGPDRHALPQEHPQPGQRQASCRYREPRQHEGHQDSKRPARADAYTFGTDDGALRVPDAIIDRWNRRPTWATAKIDGLTRVTLKGLRHTHATLLLELGKNPKVVQERLGYSTITITMNIYSHVTPAMHKSSADDFAELVGRASHISLSPWNVNGLRTWVENSWSEAISYGARGGT